ncbi:MAG TPA: hypothetical protein RMH85_16590 [Polyangiaceae bacterium LLY-WYZ-15_(1-7)]|nr:hypothetical protein [Myxococcales bacterium]MAT26641.1 hypothetical protein [Sandaracinus sp.]HJK92653.1 hypothetical protein [Polyangiaceae bacterium LLY-WYZ-15_(1-7)]MBJ72434.1 hypothetical protein [Sandaracinus sp.]HJL01290.1 hypothetical protein [Polyangiaceae bacterium LLY-WYZ-15_(1-7)]
MDERDEKKARASRRLRFAVTGALLGVASTGSGCGPSEPVMVNPAPPPEAVETSNPVAHEEAPPDETANPIGDEEPPPEAPPPDEETTTPRPPADEPTTTAGTRGPEATANPRGNEDELPPPLPIGELDD